MSKKYVRPSRATLPTTKVSCLYCMHTWNYRGVNLHNICCPRCKNRFDITKGKGLHFNTMMNQVSDLKVQLNELKGNTLENSSIHLNGEVDDENQ